MKNLFRRITLIITLVGFGAMVKAQNVGERFTLDKISYNITNLNPKEVELIPQLNSANWNPGYIQGGVVVIPASISYKGSDFAVTAIGNYTFSDCYYLNSVTIPTSIKKIGTGAFANCTGLTALDLPNSITTIDVNAFANCYGLFSIFIPASVTSIGDFAFMRAKCSFTVDEANTKYSAENGVLFDKNKTNLVQCGTEKTGAYSIPASVTNIKSNAFTTCKNLTSIEIPNSVTNIEISAFSECMGLTAIVIPASVKALRFRAFYNCTSLTSVTCLSAVPPLQDGDAFEGVPRNAPAQKITSQGNVNNSVQVAATLYVPAGSIDAYKAARYWKDFVNIVGIATGLSKLEDVGVKVWTSKGTLHISGLEKSYLSDFQIFNFYGALIHTQKITSDNMKVSLGVGTYLVRVQNSVGKVILL